MGRFLSRSAPFPGTGLGWCFVALICLFGVLPTFGQEPGQTEAEVRERLGPPTVSRTQGDRVTWVYPNGTRVVFIDGVVVDPRTGQRPPPQLITSTPPAPAPAPVPEAPSVTVETAEPAVVPPEAPAVLPSGKKAAPAPASTTAGPRTAAQAQPERAPGGSDAELVGSLVAEGFPAWRVGLLILGGVIGFVCNVILIVRAFFVSILWGLGSLFLPFVGLIFVILHWNAARIPFLVNLCVAMPLMLVALLA